MLLADFNPNDPTNRHGNRRPAGKQATLEERAALIKTPNLTDRPRFERARKIMTLGNVAFRSAVYSTCMSSATLRFQSMCAFPFCAVSCVTYKKKQNDRSMVQKTKTGRVWLSAGCSETNYLALRWRLQDSEWSSPAGKEDVTMEALMGGKNSPLCENSTITALTVLSLDMWHSSLRSCLLLSMMFSSQQPES